MIIAISGLSGSGKNAVGELVAKRLGLRVVSFSFKTEAQKSGVSLMEFQKKAGADKKIDIDFDKRIALEASKGKCVVTTWLGPWMVKNADVKIWLSASQQVRAKRVAKRDKMGEEEAQRHIEERDNDNRMRYKKLYGFDIDDHSPFDAEIESSAKTPEELAKLIVAIARKKTDAK